MTTTTDQLVGVAIELMARAMKPKHFEIYDSGFEPCNIIDRMVFLNAERVVKRARKDATAAFYALHGTVRVVPPVVAIDVCRRFYGGDNWIVFDAATAAGDLTKPKEQA